MAEIKFNYGHRWSMMELSELMGLWQKGTALREIAHQFQSSPNAILKLVQRLRNNGVPLTRRTKGHISGRSYKLWTQGEVEYLLRRRGEGATNEELASELGRSEGAICAKIYGLRLEQVPVKMRGSGKHRLYNVDALKAVAIQMLELAKEG